MVFTKEEKILFVTALARSICNLMVDDIEKGKIPEEWDGIELRALLARRAASAVYKFRGKRKRDYENILLINNL